ncbi:MAG: transcription antitermination protein NusB [Rikenellaceae bacterium]|nr:transcription antitermination protein NusB [Rikenellaceae bacterium]
MLSRRLLRIKVVKALYAHFKSESDSPITSEKNLTSSVDKTYDLYNQLLWLIVEVKRYAESRIELAKSKKLPTKEDLNPNTRFVDNQMIRQIEESDKLSEYLEKKSLGWVRYPELIKSLYDSLVASDYYRNYMEAPEVSYNDDRRLVEDFYLNTVEDNELLEEVVEEQSAYWADDIDFALILAMKTITSSRRGQPDLPISSKFKKEDDREFYKELFRKAVVKYNEYLTYIEQFTQNWDVERIAFMDNIIMVAAIAELTTFESIPVKVTLDEYIEISKFYSTPGSGHFINGVLDKVISILKQEGKINKTGRGLI